MAQIIFKHPPEGFNSQFDAVSCFVMWEERLLLLQRHSDKPQGTAWGLPAGKKQENESTRQAMIRELFEETGIIIEDVLLEHCGTVYVRYPEYDFVYHTFKLQLVEETIIEMNPAEHIAHKFVTPRDAIELPGLMPGERECIQMYLMNLGA